MEPSTLKVDIIYDDTGTITRPNGQHAGSPLTSIRVTHLPTGIIAQVGDRRNQYKCREVAMSMIEWALIELGVSS